MGFQISSPRWLQLHHTFDIVMGMEMNTNTNEICTVVTGNPMSRCGAPAVTSWTNRNGVTYWECADHAPASAPSASSPGTRTVVVYGVEKTGPVIKETDTFVWVEVPTYGGTASRVVKVRK